MEREWKEFEMEFVTRNSENVLTKSTNSEGATDSILHAQDPILIKILAQISIRDSSNGHFFVHSQSSGLACFTKLPDSSLNEYHIWQ